MNKDTKEDQKKQAWILFFEGAKLFKINKNEEALEMFNKSLDLDPKNIYTLNGKGGVFLMLSKNQEASEIFAEVLNIDPENKTAYYGQAIAWKEMGII